MSIDGDLIVPESGWRPRPHQLKLWRYLMRGGKRAVAVWHRRAGKDEVTLHAMAIAMLERPANYWFCQPEFSAARKSVWEAVNPHTGRRRIDEAIPQQMRSSTREHDMHIRAVSGSTFQVIGSDSVVSGSGIGSSTAGIVFSEWALSNPSAWAYYRPILEENQGWAAFITTPRGRNHAYELYKHASTTPGWFAETLTATDTGVLSPEALAETLREYCSLFGEDQGRALYDQELFCSWNASVLGSFFAMEMAQLRAEERITEEAIADPARPVDYAWDLGVTDDTSIWAWQQQPNGQLFILDHLVASGVGVEWYRDELFKREQQHGWTHGTDYVPHDAKIKEWGSGRTRVETMRGMGLRPMLVTLASVDDGINAVRRTLPLCVFHPRCEDGGISALEQYRREWDDEKKAFRASPLHDWASHPADAFRYLAMAWRHAPRRVIKVPKLEGWRIPPPAEARRGGIRL